MASRHQILTNFKQDKKVKEHTDLMLKKKRKYWHWRTYANVMHEPKIWQAGSI